MEGLPRSRSWSQEPVELGNSLTKWVPFSGAGWSTLSDYSIQGSIGSGSLSDHNNGSLLRSAEKAKKDPHLHKLAYALGDIGGGMTLVQRKSFYSLHNIGHWTKSGAYPHYDLSGFVAPGASQHLSTYPPAYVPLDALALNSYGTKAIALCAPTNPLADAATFLGEMRQLPSLPGRAFAKRGLKGSGSEFLNVEFGIKPIIRDGASFREANAQADAYLKQLQKSSGRYTRRNLTLVEETSTTQETISPSLGSTFPNPSNNPYAKFPLYRTTRIYEKIWFSGAFTHCYQIPSSQTEFFNRIQKARDVYGLDLSLEVAWNLMPYSWLSDWVTNIGDIAHNLTRFSQDGLVMKYGYIMRTKRTEYVYSYGPSSWTLTSEVKQRQKASPFGFGVAPVNLSERQWAILAALGQQKFWK